MELVVPAKVQSNVCREQKVRTAPRVLTEAARSGQVRLTPQRVILEASEAPAAKALRAKGAVVVAAPKEMRVVMAPAAEAEALEVAAEVAALAGHREAPALVS